MNTIVATIVIVACQTYLIMEKLNRNIDFPWWKVLLPTIIVVSGFVIVMAFVLGHWWSR